MSTDRMDGELYFHCDLSPCRRNVSYDGDTDFTAAWRLARREGWSSFKMGSDWTHACPTCTREKLGDGR